MLPLASDLRLSLKGNLAEHDICCPLVLGDPARYLPPSQGGQLPHGQPSVPVSSRGPGALAQPHEVKDSFLAVQAAT